MIGAGLLIHWMIPVMPLAVCFALAAIVSPTDPVAVGAIASKAPIPKRLMHILEGESLLNDASGLVCFRFAVAAVMTGSFSLATASLTFLWVAVAGLAVGVAVTLGVSTFQRWLWRRFGEEPGAAMLVNLLIPFAAYLLAEEIHASGILAAVAAGIAMSYVELTGRVSGSMRVQRAGVWNMLQFSFNGIMFVLLGEQLPGIVERATTTMNESGHQSAWWLLVYVVVINLALIPLRLLWVWLSLRWNLLRARRRGLEGRGAELAHRGGDLGGRRARRDHPGRCVDPATVPARWQRVPGARPGDLPGRGGDPVLAGRRQRRCRSC